MNAKNGDVIVVAFTGQKFHGKDTAAKILINNYGFKQVAFADGLRKTVATALRVNPSYFTDPATKEEVDPRTGKPRRYWLQWIGTQGFRALWNNIWIWWAMEEIVSLNVDRVVITDLRFHNELSELRANFEKVVAIRIIDPRRPASGDLHESEIEIPDLEVDMEIANHSSIAHLHAKVEHFINARFPDMMPRKNEEIFS